MNKKPSSTKFHKRVRIEISAGGVVFKRTRAGVRIAFILDPYGKWTFAKGHVEVGESLVEAALRETTEEMGFKKLKIIAPLGKIDIWFKDRYRSEMKGIVIHKYVNYFLMEAPRHEHGSPQKEELIGKILWVSLPQALEVSSYSDMRPILERVINYFSARGKRKL